MRRTLIGLSVVACLWAADDRPRLAPVPAADQNAHTGPAVGARIPAFEAVDQDGKPRTFENLRGPNGLVLLFVRSADW